MQNFKRIFLEKLILVNRSLSSDPVICKRHELFWTIFLLRLDAAPIANGLILYPTLSFEKNFENVIFKNHSNGNIYLNFKFKIQKYNKIKFELFLCLKIATYRIVKNILEILSVSSWKIQVNISNFVNVD